MKKRNATFIAVVAVTVAIVAIATILLKRNGRASSHTIEFTAVLPLTGPLAHLGENERVGMTLALQELDGRQERRIGFDFEDSQGKGPNTVSIIQKAWNVDGQRFYVIATTGPILAALPTLEANRGDMVVIAQTMYPNVTKGHTSTFRLFPSSSQEAELLADHAVATAKNKVAVLHINNEWGTESVKIFRSRLESKGGRITAVETHSFPDKDFRIVLQKLAASNPDALLLYTYPDFFPPLLDQLESLGLDQTILANTDFAVGNIQDKVSPDILGRTVFPAPRYFYDAETDRIRAFNERVRAAGHTPNFDIATFYDMTMILNAAARSSRDRSPAAFADALKLLGTHEGVTGHIKMDEHRDVHVEFALARWKNGKLELLRK